MVAQRPDHKKARAALGYLKDGGDWVEAEPVFQEKAAAFEEGDVAVWHYEYEVEAGVYEAQAFFLKDGTVFNSEVDWWNENEEEWDDVEFEEESDVE